jgi:hypothetical protein
VAWMRKTIINVMIAVIAHFMEAWAVRRPFVGCDALAL